VVGVLLVAGLVVLGVILFTGDDDDDDGKGKDDKSSQADADSPAGVVQTTLDAVADDDCDAAKEHLTESAQAVDLCSTDEYEMVASGQVEYEVGDGQEAGDAAQVPVTFTSSAGSTDYAFMLQKDGDEWLIAYFHEGGVSTDGPTDDTTDSTDDPTDDITDSTTDSTDSTDGPSGDSTASSVPNDPKSVVEAFFDAFSNGDCATAEDLVTQEYLSREGHCESDDLKNTSGITWEVGEPEYDSTGETATVKVSMKIDSSSDPIDTTVTLVKENGLWRINDGE